MNQPVVSKPARDYLLKYVAHYHSHDMGNQGIWDYLADVITYCSDMGDRGWMHNLILEFRNLTDEDVRRPDEPARV